MHTKTDHPEAEQNLFKLSKHEFTPFTAKPAPSVKGTNKKREMIQQLKEVYRA